MSLSVCPASRRSLLRSRDRLENLISHGEQQVSRLLRCQEQLLALPASRSVIRMLTDNARLIHSMRAHLDGLLDEFIALSPRPESRSDREGPDSGRLN